MSLRILCIDDSKPVHAFLKECVSSVSSQFTSVYDGNEAIQYFKNNANQVDLAFLDWEMSNKSGPEVLEEIKKQGIKTPIIMLTSKNKISDIAQVLSQGASEYIMKPFTQDIILQKISLVMQAAK